MIINLSEESKKFLKKCDKILIKRIYNKIQQLKENPIKDAKVLGGYENKTYRIRVGNYRIMYEVDTPNNTIFIIKISKRSTAYRIKDEENLDFKISSSQEQ